MHDFENREFQKFPFIKFSDKMKVKWWMFRISKKIVKYRTKNSDNREVVSLPFM